MYIANSMSENFYLSSSLVARNSSVRKNNWEILVQTMIPTYILFLYQQNYDHEDKDFSYNKIIRSLF
jgi:hypothetical protein